MLDDDPIFALVRESRPTAPPNFVRDVMARAEAPPRRSWLPAAIGAFVLAAAALIFLVLPRGTKRAPEVALLPGDAMNGLGMLDASEGPAWGHSMDAGVPMIVGDAALLDGEWTDMVSLWATIEQHRPAIEACKPPKGAITIIISRAANGSGRASHPLYGIGGRGPTPLEKCLVAAISAIEVPAMPEELSSIMFGLPIPAAPADFTDWRNPIDTIRTALDATELAKCGRREMTIIVDVGKTKPRVWVPNWVAKSFTASQAGCIRGALAKVTLPQLPAAIGEIQLRYRP